MLFDFGSADAQTGQPPIICIDVDETLGTTYSGFIDLVDAEGVGTGVQLFVDDIFDGTPNESGTESLEGPWSLVTPVSPGRHVENLSLGKRFFRLAGE